MIRTTLGQRKSQKSVHIFRESRLAKEWCKGNGIEFGAAAHNPFNLPGSINVAPADDLEIFRQAEVEMCGKFAEIDIQAEAHDVPLPDKSQDYVISSHVVEHFPDPIRAFLEWNRLLKAGGIIFMILPKPNAAPGDAEREIVSIEAIEEAYQNQYTVDNFPDESLPRRSHYYVYSLERLLELIDHCNTHHNLNWEIVTTEATDSKVGNGFTVVARYIPKAQPQPKTQVQENSSETNENVTDKERDVEASDSGTTASAGGDLQRQESNTGTKSRKTGNRKGNPGS